MAIGPTWTSQRDFVQTCLAGADIKEALLKPTESGGYELSVTFDVPTEQPCTCRQCHPELYPTGRASKGHYAIRFGPDGHRGVKRVLLNGQEVHRCTEAIVGSNGLVAFHHDRFAPFTHSSGRAHVCPCGNGACEHVARGHVEVELADPAEFASPRLGAKAKWKIFCQSLDTAEILDVKLETETRELPPKDGWRQFETTGVKTVTIRYQTSAPLTGQKD